MKTGIQFFDDREFQEGDLVVLLGAPGCGMTTLATNLAVGLARHVETDQKVIHYDLERTRPAWRRAVDRLGGRELPVEYRNAVTTDNMFSADALRRDVVVFDSVSLGVRREEREEFVRQAKNYAIRQQILVVLFDGLKMPQARTLEVEGWLDPWVLEPAMLRGSDQFHLVRRTGAGSAVVPVKSRRDSLTGPDHACTLMREENDRLVQTS